MSAASKRRWRTDPRNREHENSIRRDRLTPEQRLAETMRDTVRHQRERLEEAITEAEGRYP